MSSRVSIHLKFIEATDESVSDINATDRHLKTTGRLLTKIGFKSTEKKTPYYDFLLTMVDKI